MAPPLDRCAALASPSYTNFGISIFILVGVLVSYIPQHHRIISRRSAEGISPYWVLLGETSVTCGLSNILMLPASRADLACCREISGFECFAGVLGVLQIGVQWACFTVVLFLFLVFFQRRDTSAAPTTPSSPPSYSTAAMVTAVCVMHALAIAMVDAVVLYRYPTHLQAYANALGVSATVLASVQYLPQIWTTWRLKTVGSLSIPMMCIQTPGGYIWAASLAARVGWEGWSTWLVYVASATLQGVVLVMGVVFELRIRRRGKALASSTEGAGAGAGAEGGGEETSPLLGER